MAVQNFCDGCGKPIHLGPEVKYRADLYETGTGKRGFDLCGECFEKIRKVLPQYKRADG